MPHGPGLVRRAAVWLAAGAGLFWILAAGDLRHLPLAGLFVAATAAAGLALAPPRRWRFRVAGLVRFAPFFVWKSVAGALDVGLRALRPRPKLSPDVLCYRVGLEVESAAVLFVDLLSLIPGTLSVKLEGSEVTVHVIDRSQDNRGRLRALEERVAGLLSPVPAAPAAPKGGPE